MIAIEIGLPVLLVIVVSLTILITIVFLGEYLINRKRGKE